MRRVKMSRTNLLLFPESEQANAGDLHHLETHTGNITLSLPATTEAGNEDLVVLVDEVEAAVILLSSTISKH